jgi:hypothetical protein
MKKSVFYLLLMVAIAIIPNTSMASETKSLPITPVPTEIPAEIQVMLNRLEEIKGMDRSDLKSSERKELRVEARNIKKKVRASGNGLYISSGAIIIILLVIIIL